MRWSESARITNSNLKKRCLLQDIGEDFTWIKYLLFKNWMSILVTSIVKWNQVISDWKRTWKQIENQRSILSYSKNKLAVLRSNWIKDSYLILWSQESSCILSVKWRRWLQCNKSISKNSSQKLFKSILDLVNTHSMLRQKCKI